MPNASGSLTGNDWREPGSVFFARCLWILTTLIKFPWAFSFPGWTAIALSSFPYREMVQSLCHICGPSLHCPHYVLGPLVLRIPSPGQSTLGEAFPVLSRGDNHFPGPAGSTFPDAPQDTISCPSGKDTLLACVWPRSCSAKHLFIWTSLSIYWGHPSAYLGAGAAPTQVQDFKIPLVEHHDVPISPFLQPAQMPLDGNTALWASQPLFPVCVISKLAESTLLRVCPSGYSSPHPEMIKEDERYQSLKLHSLAYM